MCISPYGTQPIGDMWYQVFTNNVTVETQVKCVQQVGINLYYSHFLSVCSQDAADIVLVVDESGSMNREHEWLLIMITLLEQELLLAGAACWHDSGLDSGLDQRGIVALINVDTSLEISTCTPVQVWETVL